LPRATLSTRLGEERLAPLRGGGASEILGIKRTTLLARIKNLTTEVAEHAENKKRNNGIVEECNNG
jgi:hypothetical protein